MTEQDTQLLDEAFDRWWFNEGSGMPPLPGQDHEEHTKSIARIAWHNGAYVKLHHIQPPDQSMTTEHPITPPPPPQDKFKRWEDDILNERENVDVVLDCTWKDGYRAGADAELEAILKMVGQEDLPEENRYFDGLFDGLTVAAIRAIRRPKPPSLAEQAETALLHLIHAAAPQMDTNEPAHYIHRALKRLQQLEQENNA